MPKARRSQKTLPGLIVTYAVGTYASVPELRVSPVTSLSLNVSMLIKFWLAWTWTPGRSTMPAGL
ncbi:MAG: hypothetical protein BWY49_00057 [Candidatus Omnitrophica bacterium ADurb.Bin314]|nr:MAG: hypothetical protein BWY49_00057 [Candidatus Omnitrophica bacterium ADurb.Bin314]